MRARRSAATVRKPFCLPRSLSLSLSLSLLCFLLTPLLPTFVHVLGRTIGGRQHRVDGVTIVSPNWVTAPNTDGIDIAAHDVHITGVDITNGDDSICIKSPSANILVEDSIVRKGNGFVVGTASSGLDGDDQNLFDVRNVTFRNSVAIDTTFACHIKAKPPQKGTVSDVLFQNIYSLQLENSTDYRIKHGDHAGYVIGIHLFDQGRRRLMSAVDEEEAASSSAVQVNASNITFSNVSLLSGVSQCHRLLCCKRDRAASHHQSSDHRKRCLCRRLSV